MSSLQWCSKSFVVIRFSLSAWMYVILSFNDFGCSEYIWTKLCRSVCLLYISVYSLLFLIYTSISRKEILIFEILYSNLIESYFALNSCKFRVSCSLLLVHVENISWTLNRLMKVLVKIGVYIFFQNDP